MSAPQADVRRRIHPLLKLAVVGGALPAVRTQLARGADPDLTDERGRTALMMAALKGHVEVCRCLLEAGADLQALDNDGWDARALATLRGHLDVAELLSPEPQAPPDDEPDTFDLTGCESEEPDHPPAPAALGDQVTPAVEEPAPAPPAPEPSLASDRPEPVWPAHHIPAPEVRSLETADAPEPADTNDEFDLSGWEADPEPVAPSQAAPFTASRDTQTGLASHTPVDSAADWSDVRVELPIVALLVARQAEPELRAFLAEAVRIGHVHIDDVHRMAATDQERPEDLAHGLFSALDELEVRVLDEWWPLDAWDEQPSDPDEDLLDEAVEFVLDVRGRPHEMMSRFVRSSRAKRVDRGEEVRLGSEIAAGRADVALALADPSVRGLVHRTLAGLANPSLQVDVDRLLDDRPGLVRLATVLRSEPDASDLIAGIDRWTQAWSRLVEANLRLVVSMGRRAARPGIPALDMVQEGTTGLMRAADKFDFQRLNSFGTYAALWIRARTQRATQQMGVIPVSAGVSEQMSKLSRFRDLLRRGGDGCSAAAVAERMGMTIEDVFRLDALMPRLVPMDEVEQELVEEAPTPAELAESSILSTKLRHAILTLTVREAEVIRLRFGLGDGEEHTLAEIGLKLGLSRERIRQIETRVLNALRRSPQFDIAIDEVADAQ